MQAAVPDLSELLKDAHLTEYGSNALGLFTLLLRFEAEDIALVASRAITDGPNDKKCDLIFIDDEAETAVVAQSYWSSDEAKTTAPANKASDLNTAAGWLLNRDLGDIPEIIRAQAHDLREALESGKLQFLEFWYVHNLSENASVQSELATVGETAVNALRYRFPNSRCQVVVREVGKNTIRAWWRATQADVAIDKEFMVPVEGAYEERSNEWTAVAASVAARWLYDLWQEHKTELFRGNVRDYLGNYKL